MTTPARGAMVTAIVGATATALAVATVYVTQPILADIAVYFDVSVVSARVAFVVTSLCYALAFFFLGPLSDRVSPRLMAGAGGVGVATLAVAATLTGNLTVFLVLNAGIGVLAAAVPSAMFALMPRIAPPGSVGSYFGLITAAAAVGITLGRSAGGVVAGWFGWHAAFVILAVVNVTAAVVVQRLHAPSAESRADLLTVYRRSLRMYFDPRVLRFLAVGALLFFAYLGTITFLTYRLKQSPFDYDTASIGYVSLGGMVALLGAPFAGRMVPRVGARAVAVTAIGITAIGITLLGIATSAPLIVIGTLLAFFGAFSCQPAVMVELAEVVGPDNRGAAASSYLLACLGAGSIASAVLGPVWTHLHWTGVITISLVSLGLSMLIVGVRRRVPDQPVVAAPAEVRV